MLAFSLTVLIKTVLNDFLYSSEYSSKDCYLDFAVTYGCRNISVKYYVSLVRINAFIPLSKSVMVCSNE